ncbi:MAG TPA: hypothetical protein VHS97_17775, partial [Isosphaeraceae bacterium]|nr:hypothetical protein [Isosphaeraceae bacterium]
VISLAMAVSGVKNLLGPEARTLKATLAFFRRAYSTCGGDRLFSCHLHQRDGAAHDERSHRG